MSITSARTRRPSVSAANRRGDVTRQSRPTTIGPGGSAAATRAPRARPIARTVTSSRSRSATPRISYSRKARGFTCHRYRARRCAERASTILRTSCAWSFRMTRNRVTALDDHQIRGRRHRRSACRHRSSGHSRWRRRRPGCRPSCCPRRRCHEAPAAPPTTRRTSQRPGGHRDDTPRAPSRRDRSRCSARRVESPIAAVPAAIARTAAPVTGKLRVELAERRPAVAMNIPRSTGTAAREVALRGSPIGFSTTA